VCEGVSVSRSHKRALQSPDPVASNLPVGEKAAQRIGEVCPVHERFGLLDHSVHPNDFTCKCGRAPCRWSDLENGLRGTVDHKNIFD
jgi:hypothetical protein